MTGRDEAAVVAACVSAASAAVSIVGALSSARSARRQASTAEEIRDLERAREADRLLALRSARLRAELVPRVGGGRELQITNSGTATARDVRISSGGESIAADDRFLILDGEIETLGPDAHAEYFLREFQSMTRRIHIAIDWTDDSEQPGHWESDIMA